MTQGEGTDWELLGQFARRGEDVNRGLLRAVLAGALTQRGHSAIVHEASNPYTKPTSERLSKMFGAMVLWGFGFGVAAYLGIPLLLCPLGVVGAIVLMAVLMKASGDSSAVPLIMTVAWLLVGVLEATDGRFEALAIAYLVPIFLFATYAIATRALRLRDAQDVALAVGGVIRAAPLIAPVVLLVLFLPALSADVWQVADRLDLTSLLVTGLLSVGLLLVVVRLQIGSQIERVLSQRSEQLSEDAGRAELTRDQAKAVLADDGLAILEGIDDDGLDACWPNAGEEYAPFLSAAEGSVLQDPLTARLVLTVIAVGLLLSLYIYLLCSTVVSADIASQWTESTVPSKEISLAGLSVRFHGGPFLQLSALLGIAATATFLSFALLEERFATALTDALLRDPIDRLKP
jgi:hypothetical protein